MKIADFSIRHPVIIAILLAAVAGFGLLSVVTMKQDLLAQVSMPTLLVASVYPGAAPADVEREVTDVLEEEIATLSGISSISSESQNSISLITVSFNWNEDINRKIGDLRERINSAAADLPSELQGPPAIYPFTSGSLPIFEFSVESNMPRERLSPFIEDNILPRLARISGVAAANLKGGATLITEVSLDPVRLSARDISLLEVYELLKYNNVSFPAGSAVYRDNALSIRTVGEFSSLDEMRNMVVGFKEGSYIRLKDVADISLKEKKADTYAYTEGANRMVVSMLKQQEGDSIRIIDEAKEILASLEEDYGGLLEFKLLADQSRDIRLAINSVKNSALLGALLAIIILFLFLHDIRTTLIIGASIPLSIIIAFILMRLKGQTLNLMTLGGLTVAIGMIVDSSIVILENVFKHFAQTGDAVSASSRGTDEVGGAIVASTSTSLCVFIPLIFVSGFAGIILKDLAYVIVYALGASMITAVIVIPFLTSQLLKVKIPPRLIPSSQAGPLGRWKIRFVRIKEGAAAKIDKGLNWLEGHYRRTLIWAIGNRKFVLIFAVAVFILSIMALDFLGFQFLAETDMDEFTMEIENPASYTLEDSREKAVQIEEVLYRLVPEVDNAVFYVGQASSISLSSSRNKIFTRVRLAPHDERNRSIFDIIQLLQRELPRQIPDCSITVLNGGLTSMLSMATGGNGFMIEIYGNNLEEVTVSAKKLAQLMEQDPDVAKAELNVSFEQQEMVSNLALDYMGTLGVTPYEAAVTSRILFNGMEAGKYRTPEGSYDIFMTSPLAGKTITDDIVNQISLKSQSGSFITLANITDLELQPGVDKINHENRMKSIMVTGHLKGADVRGVQGRMTAAIRELQLPPGVHWEVAGSAAEMKDTFMSLLLAMGIAVFLVYTVMVIQFEQFLQPLIVMASIPFTLIGVISSLLFFNSTLSIVSFMGIIALSGMVVNNAIVLIDYINLLRQRDEMDLVDAILEGGSTRLKPILMTTLTTILGIIPMAVGAGEGAELYAPLGQAIGGGLITSTLITLFLIPVLYYILEHHVSQVKKKLEELYRSPSQEVSHDTE